MTEPEKDTTQIEEFNSEIDDLNNSIIIPGKGNGRVRNLIGFWLLGLCNNYPYVIMLSAAYDLLYPKTEGGVQLNVTSTNVTRCNEISTGAILLADILPSLFIKLVAPFIVLRTQFRVMIAVVLCAASFIITSFSTSHWVTFLGVICAALSSGLGEVTYLSYSSFFDKDVVSTWSSGTGGAGVIGALSYASLKEFFDLRTTLRIMLITPVLTAVTFWILIVHPTSLKDGCQSCLCSSERKPILAGDIDVSSKDYVSKSKSYTFAKKLSLVKPLLKYMIPLGLVYFAEYFINQGLMELLYFQNVRDWLPHEKQYRW
ncbi:Battenin [Araneus ventricosus]|uniref:Battenin n=1 Tax=Araneus ventricosus TaxID=182803 RepID=A0A4Y2AUF8_ARAVE|nr:Battenin [Araneus ventricosus]